MNYLLFVYYNTDVTNSEEKTQEIGGFISDVMTFEKTNFDQGTPHRFHDSCIAIKEALRLQNKRNLEDKL